MSRQGVPKIAPEDLRDHASDALIARVWDRIEQDLNSIEPQPTRRSNVAVLLLAATFAAFGGGLLVGKAVWNETPPVETATHVKQDIPQRVDVLASGMQGRTFPLPGGGEITLAPGTTIEVEQAPEGALTLRLVQGAASVDTIKVERSAALAIIAGEARLSTQAGSVLHVRHNIDDIDVDVSDGSVRLTSPSGSQDLGRGARIQRFPIRPRATVVPTTPPPTRVVQRQPIIEEVPPTLPDAVVVTATAPDWRTRYNANDFPGALQILQQSGGISGAIERAKTPQELMALSDLGRGKGGDPNAAMRALKRVVEEFPNDAAASIAAYYLRDMYKKSGNTEMAAKYNAQAGRLAALAETSACSQIQTELSASHKDEAIRMAKEYETKYPNGQCIEEVQRILAGDDSTSDEEPKEPKAPAADASVAP